MLSASLSPCTRLCCEQLVVDVLSAALDARHLTFWTVFRKGGAETDAQRLDVRLLLCVDSLQVLDLPMLRVYLRLQLVDQLRLLLHLFPQLSCLVALSLSRSWLQQHSDRGWLWCSVDSALLLLPMLLSLLLAMYMARSSIVTFTLTTGRSTQSFRLVLCECFVDACELVRMLPPVHTVEQPLQRVALALAELPQLCPRVDLLVDVSCLIAAVCERHGRCVSEDGRTAS